MTDWHSALQSYLLSHGKVLPDLHPLDNGAGCEVIKLLLEGLRSSSEAKAHIPEALEIFKRNDDCLSSTLLEVFQEQEASLLFQAPRFLGPTRLAMRDASLQELIEQSSHHVELRALQGMASFALGNLRLDQKKFDEAHSLFDAASALLAELEGNDTAVQERRMQCLRARLTAARKLQDQTSYLSALQDFISVLRSAGDLSELAEALSEVGSFYRQFGDPQAALAAHDEAGAIYRSLGENFAFDLAGSLVNGANALRELRLYHASLEKFDEAAEILEQLTSEQIPKYLRGLATLLNNRSLLLREMRRLDRAYNDALRSVQLIGLLDAEPRVRTH